MERKFLEGMGLAKDAVDKVLDEHSREIGRQKSVIDQLAAEKSKLDAEVKRVRRDAETKAFLSNVKFVNEETRAFYAERLNAALDDGADEEADRAALLAELTKGRANVFAEQAEKTNRVVLPPAGNMDAGRGGNPFRQETWNMAEQARLYREDPDGARRLAKEAGQTVF